MNYYPDRYLVVKITNGDKFHYRVFASWYGGFAGSDSWKMNSGIESVVFENDVYKFLGSSGSVYCCHRETWGYSSYSLGVLSGLIDDIKGVGGEIEIVPDCDWTKFNFNS